MITPRVVAAWLALLLVWAPLPYGSVTPVALLVLRLALALAGIALVWGGEGLREARAVGGAAAGLLGLALLGLLQSLAWPGGLARLVSPRHAELASSLQEGVLESTRSGVALSLMPGATLSVAVTLALLVCALAAAAYVGRSVRGRMVLFAALAASVLFQLLYGLRHWLSESTEIWGRAVDTPGGNRLRGTLVNGDHTALLLEIGMALFLAWLWWAGHRARRTPGLERRLLLVAPPALCWAATAVGVVLTGSRAALLAAAVGTAGQCLLMLGWSRLRWAPLAVLPAAGVAALVMWVAPSVGFSRLLATSWDEIVTNPRFRIWGLALDVWRGFPATGAGLGAWEEAVAQVQPAALAGPRWTRAHNDFLELLATGGIVGAVLLGVALVTWLRRLSLRLAPDRPSIERASAQAALGAALAVGIHELFDFGLTLPSNALAMVVLAGAASASLSRSPSGGPRPVTRPGS